MDKQYFYFKLIPPRATFPKDITPEETALMAQHAAYCQQQFDAGKLLTYGPVMSPRKRLGWGFSRSPTRPKPITLARMIPPYLGD